MNKIFKVASYDFRRLVFNPITTIFFIVIIICCMILGATIKLPTTPAYEANISGQTATEIYNNFVSSDKNLDTQSNLDLLLEEAQEYINAQTQSTHYGDLEEINTAFNEVYKEIEKYSIRHDCIYLQTGLGKLRTLALSLKNDFFANFKKLNGLESNVILKISQVETIETANNAIIEELLKDKSTEAHLDYFAQNLNLFETITSSLDKNKICTYDADPQLLTSLSNTLTIANAKKDKIFEEIQNVSTQASKTEEIKSLITNYKLTCESGKKIVETKLRLAISKHFKNLSDLQNFEPLKADEEKLALSKAEFFLEDTSLYFTKYQEPLNFYSASYEVSLYDEAYFLTSIIGFLLVIFAIFLAYKLFGRDRRSGKMDIVLSQNISFNQVFAGKFLAIVFTTSFFLLVFAALALLWGTLFYPALPNAILSVFNMTHLYTISPIGFFLIKLLGFELQAIFYAVMTIFIMNLSRKFELNFAIALLIFAVATVCNIFLNGSIVYCLFPFIHADITSYLGGATMQTGFLKTSLYAFGNFYISLAYYLVVVILMYSFTRQLFKKN